MPNTPDAPVADLDLEAIGSALVMLAPTAVGLRHTSVESTLRDYIHPEPLSASDFVRDLFVMPLGEVVEKWYGGRMGAGRMAADAMDEFIAELRNPA